MAIRKLFLGKPVAVNEQDDLLLYYYYKKNIRGSSINSQNDPMLLTEGLNVGADFDSKFKIWKWSLGGFTGQTPVAPDQPTYRDWVAGYWRTDGASSRFYGRINENLYLNLPRFFEREREETYRKIIGASEVASYMASLKVVADGFEDTGIVEWNDVKNNPSFFANETVYYFFKALAEEINNELPYIRKVLNELRESDPSLDFSLGDIISNEQSDLYFSSNNTDQIKIRTDSFRNNFRNLIVSLLGAEYLTTSSSRRQSPRNPRSLAPRLVFNALINSTRYTSGNSHPFSLSNLLKKVASSREFRTGQPASNTLSSVRNVFSYFKTSQVTPFVEEQSTRKILEREGRVSIDFEAQVKPNYNLYIPNYESAISPAEVRETSLVNIYALHIASEAVNTPEAEGRVPAGNFALAENLPTTTNEGLISRIAEYMGLNQSDTGVNRDQAGTLEDSEEIPPDEGANSDTPPISRTVIFDAGIHTYENVLENATLNGQISAESLANPQLDQRGRENDDNYSSIITPGDYYSAVANFIRTDETSGDVTETIILPTTDEELIAEIGSRQSVAPLNIELKFHKDSQQGAASSLIKSSLKSVGIMCGISSSQPQQKPCSLMTNNISLQNGQGSVGSLAEKNLLLNFYPLSDVMTFGSEEGETAKPLIISDKCLEGATSARPFPYITEYGPETNLRFMTRLTSISNDQMKTYPDILKIASPNEEELQTYTKSEAIGYKITKRKLILEEDAQEYTRGPVEQTILIGNIPPNSNPNNVRRDLITYVDSQVKYGDVYEYSLSEFRLIYGTEYEFFMIGTDVPIGLQGFGDENAPAVRSTLNYGSNGSTLTPENVVYTCYTLERPKMELVEIPIYDRQVYGGENFQNWDIGSRMRTDPSFGLCYPPVRILDDPPPFPDLKVLSMKGIKDKVKLIMTPSAGSYIGDSALPAIFLPHSGTFYPEAASMFDIIRYQRQYSDPPPKLQKVQGLEGLFTSINCKSEGVQEIKAIKLFRSTNIDKNAPSIAEVYQSFDSFKNPETVQELTLVNTLYAPEFEIDENKRQVPVVSYDIIDSIMPNTHYYYTCVAIDAHDNFSPPSPIYQVRLVFDKGLLIPEVSLYEHTPVPSHVPTKKFARFLQIAPSALQSNPFTERNDNGRLTSVRSIASQEGQDSITSNRFVARLTSKDTGRKFDLELNFKYKDTRITPEEE